jgi:hypothetical protein
VLGLEDFDAWNLALGDLHDHSRKMLSGPYSAWSAAWIAFLSRYRGVSLMQSPMSVTSCEQQSICSDWLLYKWHWLQGSVAPAPHSVSRPRLLGRFPIPSERLASTPGVCAGHGACVEGSPSLLCAPGQARAVAAFNPTQHQSPAAGRIAAGGRGGMKAVVVVVRVYVGGGAQRRLPRRLAIYYFIRCGWGKTMRRSRRQKVV